MPDAPFGSEQMSFQNERTSNSGSEAVSIDAARIYDSCGAKDCLNDLPVMFTQSNQTLVDNACSVRINSANVITSTVQVEPVAFHRGFYSVDMVFYFAVSCELYSSTGAIPSTVTGLAMYGKRVVLYGSDGNVKSFSSDSPVVCDTIDPECSCADTNSLPRATVQISSPMALSAKLRNYRNNERNLPCNVIPECVTEYFGGEFVQPSENRLFATLGIFTITQLQRNVQLVIPSYDFCVPRKECAARTDDPCEVFSKIEFPTDSFFPPNVVDNERGGDGRNFECGCNE